MSKRRSSRNRTGKKKQHRVLLIAVEGETEENYLKYLKQIYGLNIRTEFVKKSTLGKDLKQEIEKLCSSYSLDPEELLLVYDLENSKEEFEKFISNGKLIHPYTYLVQPCIEFHFLMHHSSSNCSTDKINAPKDVIKELQKHLPNYKKGNQFDWSKNSIGKEEIDLAASRSVSSFKSYKQKSFSNLGRLIKNHFEQ